MGFNVIPNFIYYSIILVLIILLFLYLKTGSIYLTLKTFCSFAYLYIAVLAYLNKQSNLIYFHLLFIGLIFSFIGDILLALYRNLLENKLLLSGIISFGMTHIFYSLSFIYLGSFNILVFVCTILISFIFMAILKLFKNSNLKNMSTLVFIYIILICFMVCNAISFFYYNLNNVGAKLITTGALLFMLSDFIIYFVLFKNQKDNKLLCSLVLIFYYTSQFIIASSIFHI